MFFSVNRINEVYSISVDFTLTVNSAEYLQEVTVNTSALQLFSIVICCKWHIIIIINTIMSHARGVSCWLLCTQQQKHAIIHSCALMMETTEMAKRKAGFKKTEPNKTFVKQSEVNPCSLWRDSTLQRNTVSVAFTRQEDLHNLTVH